MKVLKDETGFFVKVKTGQLYNIRQSLRNPYAVIGVSSRNVLILENHDGEIITYPTIIPEKFTLLHDADDCYFEHKLKIDIDNITEIDIEQST